MPVIILSEAMTGRTQRLCQAILDSIPVQSPQLISTNAKKVDIVLALEAVLKSDSKSYIVLMGNTAFKILYPRLSFKQYLSSTTQWNGIPLVVTHNPARAISEGDSRYAEIIEADIRKLLSPCNVLTTSYRFLLEDGKPLVALDLETSNRQVVSVATFPVSRSPFATGVVGGHNIKFDLYWAVKAGLLDLRSLYDLTIHDSMLLSLTTDDYPENGLKVLGGVYSGIAWTFNEIALLKSLVAGKEVDKELLSSYNDKDARASYCILSKLWEKQTPLYRRLCSVLPCLVEMELNGVRVNLEAIKEKQKELSDKLVALQAVWPDVKFTSPKQIGKLLEMHISERTPSNLVSTRKEVLQALSVPVAIAVCSYRKARKTLDTLTNLATHVEEDLLHPSYFLGKSHDWATEGGTVTGRLSCRRPNLQNPHQGGLRSVFIAREGYDMVEMDLSQIELRVMAELSQDRAMLEAFRNHEDLHQLTADSLGIPRTTAKTVNFALLYGASPQGLREKLVLESKDTGLAECRTYIRQWYARYAGVREFQHTVLKNAEAERELTNCFGWRIKFSDRWNKYQERRALNFYPQSVAGLITVLIWIPLLIRYSHAYNWKPCITVHDSIVFDVPSDTSAELLETFAKEFCGQVEAEVLKSVPVCVNIKRGKDWGNLHETNKT